MKKREKNPKKKKKLIKQINNLPDKEFEALVIKMLTELRKRIDEHSENFNKELENIKKNQSELKNPITELKIALEGFSSRLDEAEERIS